MKKSYTQIVKEIEKLQAEADRMHRDEIEKVVTRIREEMATYGITAADLGIAAPVRRKRAAAAPGKKAGAKKRAGKAVIKFRHANGGTWGGLGKRPQWLRDELAAGKKLEDFLVK